MARVVALAAVVVSATAKDVIHWTLNPSYVFDVSGFVAPHPPKPLMIWNRPGNDFNDNEFFEHDNAGTIKWNDWCLEAASGDNGAVIQVNTCNSNNANQKWNLKGTSYGSLIQLQNTNKCVNVQNNEQKSGVPLQIWDCVDDQKMSFSFGGSQAPVPHPHHQPPQAPAQSAPTSARARASLRVIAAVTTMVLGPCGSAARKTVSSSPSHGSAVSQVAIAIR